MIKWIVYNKRDINNRQYRITVPVWCIDNKIFKNEEKGIIFPDLGGHGV